LGGELENYRPKTKAAVIRNSQKLFGGFVHECSRGFAPISFTSDENSL